MARRNDDYDWIFDYALQFLESDKFDAAVMDFVDEKCDVFTDDDENKLIYTSIHKEFCDHVEALISSNLGELGITNELFLESCEKAREGRDINATVFERLTAMDDFQTFKKIMAKRNAELQVEAMRSFKVNTPLPTMAKTNLFSTTGGAEGKDDAEYELLSPEEMRALLEADDMCNLNDMDEEDIQEMLLASLMEMEFLHRQEELEHLELARALTLSMAAEEERLLQLMAEAKLSDDEAGDRGGGYEGALHSDAKAPSTPAPTREDAAGYKPSAPMGSGSSGSSGSKADSPSSSGGGAKGEPAGPGSASKAPLAAVSEPKLAPLRELKPLSSKPLPSIGAGAGALASASLQSLAEKKRAAEEAIRRSQEQLAEQRRQEEALRNQAISTGGLDAAEVERRAQHMRQQRELLIARKKAARDEKVQIEEERLAKKLAADQEVLADSIQRVERSKQQAGSRDGADHKASQREQEELADIRRATMRNALARRMKMDLIEKEEAKLSQLQEDQFSELDQRLRQVEQLREDNRKREIMMSKQLERHQAQIARNVRMSAAELREEP